MSRPAEPPPAPPATHSLPPAAEPGGGDGIVLVAVPVAYVSQVARLLADLDARQRARPRRRHRPEPKPEQRGADWPVDDLRRLSQGRSATHRTVAAVLDALAAEPGRQFTVVQLAAVTGRPREKVVGAMAGLTRLLKAHYDYAGYGLPFTRVAGRPEGPRELYYTLHEHQAARWREARGGASIRLQSGQGG